MANIELSDGVVVELRDKVTARIRLSLMRASMGKSDNVIAGLSGMEAALPLMIIGVAREGVKIPTETPFEWILDNTESIDPLMAYLAETLNKATDPNALGGSSTTDEKEKETRPSKQSA
jgi:hypothetical protein